jgi:HTH-type transcriptional regulator / antitoxin HigA
MEMSTSTLDAPNIRLVASAAKLNVPRYGELLKRFAPKVIETAEENRRALQIVEQLMLKGDGKRYAEENALLGLLASLIDQFERRAYPTPAVAPKDLLLELMEHNNLKPADLAGVMGGRPRVSDVLSGKRSISKEQAKRLGERFRISPAAFI